MILKLFEACEGGAAERLPLQDRKPYLDLIEPGRACRREMKLHIGVSLEPMIVFLVGVVVVEDYVKLSIRKGRSDAVHEVEIAFAHGSSDGLIVTASPSAVSTSQSDRYPSGSLE